MMKFLIVREVEKDRIRKKVFLEHNAVREVYWSAFRTSFMKYIYFKKVAVTNVQKEWL